MDTRKPGSTDSSATAPGGLASGAESRRVSLRKALRCPATVLLPGNVTRQGILFDVGLDGLCVVLARPLSSLQCSIAFDLPGPQGPARLTLAARIAYSSFVGPQSFKVGLRFTSVDSVAAQVLAAFIGR